MSEAKNAEGTTYHIRVRSNLDPKWAGWFDGFVLTSQDGDETLLHGMVADQAALHGVLSKINSLGLPLILVAQVDNLYEGRRCPLCGQVIELTEESQKKGAHKS